MSAEKRVQITVEERRRIRDSMSEEDRRKLFQEADSRTMQRLFSGGADEASRFEARFEQIEKRLETLESKK